MRKGLIAIACNTVLLAGCANSGNGPGEFGMNKTTGGGLLGAVGGAVAGAPLGQGQGPTPDAGNTGSVTPVREGRVASTGEYCREFQQTVQVGGKSQNAYGTACRQPD